MDRAAEKTRMEFPALTGLRALAAFGVFVHHFTPRREEVGDFLAGFCFEWHAGVTVFYVLSGFLIAYRYWDSAEVSRAWYGGYIRSRFARIYPVFFLTTAAALLIKRVGSWKIWVLNLTLLSNVFNPIGFAVPQAWSLGVEELFYFSAPLVFLSLRRGTRWFEAWVCVLAVGLLLLALGHWVPDSGYFSNPEQFLLRTYFGRSFEFFCGILLAERVMARKPGVFKGFDTLTGAAGVLLVICLQTFFRADESGQGWSIPGIAMNNLLLPPLIAILIGGLISEKTWFASFLGTAPMKLLGRSSYAFYLIHYGHLSGYFIDRLKIGVWQLFVVMNLASVAVYLLVEEPLRKAIRR